MFANCGFIKISEEQTSLYSIPFSIPSEGEGTIGSSSLTNMFSNTGGLFTGTPEINKTYYLLNYQNLNGSFSLISNTKEKITLHSHEYSRTWGGTIEY